MIRFLKKLAHKRVLFALFIITFLLELCLIYITHQIELVSGSRTLLDTQLTYTAQEAYQILDRMGAEGRSLYLKGLAVDMIFPLAYSLFLAGMVFRLLWNRHFPLKHSALISTIPLFTGVFDYLENIFEIQLVTQFPPLAEPLIYWSSRFTLLKWITLSVSVTVLLFLWISQIIRDLKRGTFN
ncbi:MAG: hypothetical protein GXO78_15440 [Calditrichaeota bacterium]|nr:hypothetical protein [Calditrichota bacterium]